MIGRTALAAALLLPASAFGLIAATPAAGPSQSGKALFDHHCKACHGPGIGNPGDPMKPGTGALTAKYKGTLPGLLEERTDLTPETIAYFVRNGASVMAPYRKTEINDADLAAIGAYLSRGNPDLKSKKRK